MTTSPAHAEGPRDYPIARKCPYRPADELIALREAGPLTQVRLYNGRLAWLVTDTARARAVLSDYKKVSIRPNLDTFPLLNQEFEAIVDSGFADVLFGVDPPVHTEQRTMIMPSLTLRRSEMLKDGIQKIVDEYFDAMMSGGNTADLVSQIAQPVPSLVVSLLLGVPFDERPDFEAPARKLFSTDPAVAGEAMGELSE